MAAAQLLATPPARASGAPAEVARELTIGLAGGVADARAAIDRINPAPSAARALQALALGERLALAPSLLDRRPGLAAFGLIWRTAPGPTMHRVPPRAFDGFAVPGYVKLRWELSAQPYHDGYALLTVRTRLAATDEAARGALLDAWGLVGAAVATLAQRHARAVKALAEDDDAWAA
jgi:hypothetical protein